MKRLITIMLILISSCATKPQYHIELQALQNDMWKPIIQEPSSVYIKVGNETLRSKCRHNVLLQQHIISEYSNIKTRYVLQIFTDGQYKTIYTTDSYTKAVKYYQQHKKFFEKRWFFYLTLMQSCIILHSLIDKKYWVSITIF